MIVTAGGFNGGYGLYLLNGKPVFNYNLLMLAQFRCESQLPIEPGKHTIVFDFKYDGPGVAKSGTGMLTVDGAGRRHTDDAAYDPVPAASLTRPSTSGSTPAHRGERKGLPGARSASTARSIS